MANFCSANPGNTSCGIGASNACGIEAFVDTPSFSLNISQLESPSGVKNSAVTLQAATSLPSVNVLPVLSCAIAATHAPTPALGIPDFAAAVHSAIKKKRPHAKSIIKCGPLLEIDENIQRLVEKGGENNSEEKDGWACRRFDGWRSAKGYSIDIAIEALELKVFANMLETFILQIQRQDGELFPPETLRCLMLCFNRMIRMEQNRRVAQTNNPELPFNIMSHPFLRQAVINLEIAMQRSGKCGKVKQRKKSKILTAEDEKKILAHEAHQITWADGLQKRFAYYCMSRFLVRGGEELAKLWDIMFWNDEDGFGKYLGFSETVDKNHKVSRNHFKAEDFRAIVKCREPDVIFTWKCLESHLPQYVVDDEFGGRYIFSQVIMKSVSNPNVWYNTNHCSAATLRKFVKQMALNAGLGNEYDNKSCRATAITWLQAGGVPEDVGMEITGHKSMEAYKRYDQSGDVRVVAAMRVIASGGTINYELALKEVKNERKNVSSHPISENDQTVDNHQACIKEPILKMASCDDTGAENCNERVRVITGELGTKATHYGTLVNEVPWPDSDLLEAACAKAELQKRVQDIVSGVSISGNKNCSFTINFQMSKDQSSFATSMTK